MPEPLPGRTPPFEVTAGYHPFVDLRFVYAGRPRWVGPEGQALSMWGLDKPARVQDAHVAVPRGIGLAVHPAERSAPILTCTEPWEHANGGPTIIRDGGLYRMWYHAIPPDFWDPARGGTLTWGPDYGGVLCYAESDDGLAWRKPKLGLYRWQGRDDTNIVFGRELAGPPGLHGISVFLDPSAPAHERYKALYVAPIESDAAREWVRRHPDATDPWVATEHRQQAVYVATSPDGLRWTPFPEPVLLYFSDTKNVVNWNPERQSYVWYARGWSWERRTIARAETRDFFRWPLPAPSLAAPPWDAPATDLYTNGKVTYPGDASTHLMFPTLYDRARDTTSLALAASPDDLAWHWIPGGPVLTTGAPGTFDAGCLFSAKGLVALPGDRLGTPYTGYNVPHKYPRHELRSVSAYATWPRGRLAGITAPGDGEFWTPPLRLHGQGLRLNVRTAREGHVRIELVRGNLGPPYDAALRGIPARPGRSLAEATPITGDHLDAAVAWGQAATLGLTEFQPAAFRFVLHKATLFGFEVTAA